MGVRILGPTFGFLLGSFCTRLNVDIFYFPSYDPTDPRWVGAWWLGHVIISFCLLLTSLIMILFPKRLPSKTEKYHIHQTPFSKNDFNSLTSEIFEDLSPLTEETLSVESSTLTSAKSSLPPGSVHIPYDPLDIKPQQLHPSSIMEVPSLSVGGRPGGRRLKGMAEPSSRWGKEDTKQRSLKDFMNVIFRLLKNQIFVTRTISNVLHMLPIAGLYTFLPKYFETQFKLPVHTAAMISGVGGIFVMGLGIFVSGFVIRRLNPSPRAIAAWIAVTALLYSVGMMILMLLGCSQEDIQGRIDKERFRASHTSQFRPICQRSCETCDSDIYAPICSDEGKQYFSACHAGCMTASYSNETKDLTFTNCECLGEEITAKLQSCDSSCPNLVWYILVFCIFVVIHSTSEVGGMLITLRCVNSHDKAMALGVISVAIGLFANVPCPIIYGAVIDYACIHWRKSCDAQGQGACQIYDPDIFRAFFHGTTAFVMVFAFFADLFVWHLCKGMSFSKDKDQLEPEQTPRTAALPSYTLTMDRNSKNETDSVLSSTVSSQRKRESLDEEEDDEFLPDGSTNKEVVYPEGELRRKPLQFQYHVKECPLRESII